MANTKISALTAGNTAQATDEIPAARTGTNVKLTPPNIFAYANLVPGTNLIDQRNGANAQSYYVYNTYTNSSNYERASIAWSANVLSIGAEALGTGSIRTLIVNGGTASRLNSNGLNIVFWNYNGGTNAYEFYPVSDGSVDLGRSQSAGGGQWKRFYVSYTNTATVGAVTINKAAGRVNIAAAGTSVVVTNSFCTAAAKVFAVVASNDATAYIKNVVPAAGSFTITLGAAATAQTAIDFFIVNAD